MNSYHLNIKTLLERTARYFPENEIVSRESSGQIFRYNYSEFYSRVLRLANVLKSLGIKRGDKIASFAWNNHRHLELYFGVPCYGALLHTVNIRYGEQELIYTINHAEDKVLFFDKDLLPTIEAIAHQLPTVKVFVILGDNIPESTTLSSLYSYEELLFHADPNFYFEELEENSPATMCYTSATTGLPKGVVYTHRSIYLHASALCCTDVMAFSECDNILPIVPMFHVNAWGIPYAAIATGAKLVLPGERPKAIDLLEIIESEKITAAAGAVTLGIDMLAILEERPYDLSSLRQLHLGGQAVPKAVIEKFFIYGVPVVQGFGATEASPMVSFTRIRRDQQHLSDDEKINIRSRQGILLHGLEMKIMDDSGKEVAWDDEHMGELLLRGPWITSEYYNDERSSSAFADGWWKSGDIATINKQGSIRIVDRNKDVIKSGGEWISSVQLENELMAHPSVLEACVVAIPHEKWMERPLACVLLKRDHNKTKIEEELINWLSPKFPKWWLPDQFMFVNEIPKNANGKYNKNLLRKMVSQTQLT